MIHVLKAAMRSPGFKVKDEELKKIVSDIDGNGNGADFAEPLAMMTSEVDGKLRASRGHRGVQAVRRRHLQDLLPQPRPLGRARRCCR